MTPTPPRMLPASGQGAKRLLILTSHSAKPPNSSTPVPFGLPKTQVACGRVAQAEDLNGVFQSSPNKIRAFRGRQ